MVHHQQTATGQCPVQTVGEPRHAEVARSERAVWRRYQCISHLIVVANQRTDLVLARDEGFRFDVTASDPFAVDDQRWKGWVDRRVEDAIRVSLSVLALDPDQILIAQREVRAEDHVRQTRIYRRSVREICEASAHDRTAEFHVLIADGDP